MNRIGEWFRNPFPTPTHKIGQLFFMIMISEPLCSESLPYVQVEEEEVGERDWTGELDSMNDVLCMLEVP